MLVGVWLEIHVVRLLCQINIDRSSIPDMLLFYISKCTKFPSTYFSFTLMFFIHTWFTTGDWNPAFTWRIHCKIFLLKFVYI